MADALRDLQLGFAAHLRDPEAHPAPADVEDRRMAIYRRLFFRNLSNFIAKSFPVLRQLTTDERWNRLIREFFSGHACHTPMFPEIPREFLQFLQARDDKNDPPFWLELAHYEWVELALDLDDRELDAVRANPDGDLLEGVPVMSPLAWPLSYRFPVHEIRPDFQPMDPPAEPTHLLVYRNRADQVKFMRLNAVTTRVIALLGEDEGHSGRQVVEVVASELSHPQPGALLERGHALLRDLVARDVLLGTRA